MPSGPNPILNSSNAYIAVTNFAGYTGTGADGVALSVRATDWIPLTTSNGSATGQIGVAVVNVGAQVAPLPPEGGVFDTTVLEATGNGSVPAGVLSWSVTAKSGTVTVAGQAMAAGETVGGGGYSGFVMNQAVAYTVSGGSAKVVYDEIV